jgi:serine/threonine protein kinase
LRELRHPGVVEALGWYPNDGPFLALDYVAGPSLERLIERGRLSQGAIVRMAADAANTLCYLAALPQPVIHCDIKPGNLIVPDQGGPTVLVDFGSAAQMRAGESVAQTERYGTPGYAAPEQYHGEAVPRSDVYGLAATLYHALTGDDPTAHPLTFPALSTLPPDIAAVLTEALAREINARPDPCAFRDKLRRLAGSYGA